MQEKVIEEGFWCKKCKLFLDNDTLLDPEFGCGGCRIDEDWERVEILMRKKTVHEALTNLNRAAEKIMAVETEFDEY